MYQGSRKMLKKEADMRTRIVYLAVVAILILVVFACCWRIFGNRPVIVIGPEYATQSSYMQHFKVSLPRGWSIGPIRVAAKDRLLGRGRPYPHVTPEQDALVEACGSPKTDAAALERILAFHPRAFYPEYQLSQWYLEHRDMPGYRQWLEASLRDAPAVVAGRVQYGDGRPIPGFEVGLGLRFIRTGPEPQQNPLADVSFQAMTDSDGFYYMPAYRVPCSQASWQSRRPPSCVLNPMDYTTEWDPSPPQTFVIPARVGLFPPIIARPTMRLHPPFDETQSSPEKPIPIRGPRLHLSWDPYPGATGYWVEIYELAVHPGQTCYRSLLSRRDPNSLFDHTSPKLQFDLLLSSVNPILNRNHVYQFAVHVMRGKTDLSASRQVWIRAVDALAPIPPSIEALNKALAPDCRITSLVHEDGYIVITGTCPAGAHRIPSDKIPALLWLQSVTLQYQKDTSSPSRAQFTERLDLDESDFGPNRGRDG